MERPDLTTPSTSGRSELGPAARRKRTQIVPTLLVTGPVGVGKTSVAYAMSDVLDAARVPHAVVDFDAIRACYPWTDRWNAVIGYRNLAAVWSNFDALGIDKLIIANVLEERRELDDYRDAVPGAEITVVRLRASDSSLLARVGLRDHGTRRERHAARAIELARQMDRDALEDVVVGTDGRGVDDVAREVLRSARWA